jgi:hypothetical protein
MLGSPTTIRSGAFNPQLARCLSVCEMVPQDDYGEKIQRISLHRLVDPCRKNKINQPGKAEKGKQEIVEKA